IRIRPGEPRIGPLFSVKPAQGTGRLELVAEAFRLFCRAVAPVDGVGLNQRGNARHPSFQPLMLHPLRYFRPKPLRHFRLDIRVLRADGIHCRRFSPEKALVCSKYRTFTRVDTRSHHASAALNSKYRSAPRILANERPPAYP